MNEETSDQNQSALNEDVALAGSVDPYETSLYWKVQIHEILSGNRASQIIYTRGSASDYLKTLFPRSSKSTVAHHFCVEALNEILNELSLFSLAPSSLNHLLDLLIEFKPRNGFSSIVSFLKLGGRGEPNFLPVGAAVAVDLHQKTLETMGTYFDVPPLSNSEPAFLTYVEILKQQLRTDYRGYAVAELLKLEVLQPDSKEFKTFITEHPDTFDEIVPNLSLYGSAGYGLDDIRSLFYVSLEAGRDVFNQLVEAIEKSGGQLERAEQEDPRDVDETVETPTYLLRLFNGTVIPINLTEEQVDLIYRYRYEDDTEVDVRRLLSDRSLTSSQRAEKATELFAKSCMLDTKGVERFVDEVENNDATLETDLDNNRVYLKHKGREININLWDVDAAHWEIYLRFLRERESIPSDPDDINDTMIKIFAQVEKAFVAAGGGGRR
jgi:hypothetical protein